MKIILILALFPCASLLAAYRAYVPAAIIAAGIVILVSLELQNS